MGISVKRNLLNFLYNTDRAIASLFGAPPQETISSESGRFAQRHVFWARKMAWVLDKIQPNHVENAISHADRLDAVDDGKEQ